MLGLITSAWLTYICVRDVSYFARLARRGRRTHGRILRDHVVRGPGYGRLHYPLVAFQDEQGNAHEVRSRFHHVSSFRDLAREVVVDYDPSRPNTHAEALVWKHLVPTAVTLMLLCTVVVGLTILSLSLLSTAATWSDGGL